MKTINHTSSLKTIRAFAFAFLVIFLTFSITTSWIVSQATVRAAGEGAWVSTDKQDYSPEETVIISGGGFNALANVTVTVQRPDGSIDTVYALAGYDGDFVCKYQLDGIVGTYTVTATDGTNEASTTFTDLAIVSVFASSSDGTPKSSFTVGENVYAVITTNGGGTKDVRIYVLSSLPDIGDPLTDVSGGYESVTLSGGTNGPFLVWAVSEAGPYYIFVDHTKSGYRAGGERFCQFSVGPVAPATADVTFYQDGVGTDFTGTVLTVDGVDYGAAVAAAGVTITKTIGDPISFEYHSTLVVDGKQYVWHDTSGLSAAQSGTVNVPSGGGSVTGTYNTQFKVHFEWSGLGTDADAKTVVTITVGGTPIVKAGVDPFYDEWLDSGTTVSYAYEGPIVITPDVKQYRLVSVAGNSADQSHDFGAISGAITEAALYHAQFYLTMSTNFGSVLPVSGWHDEGDIITISATAPDLIYLPGEEQYVWNGWTGSGDGSYTDGNNPATDAVTMNGPITETASWTHQFYITVTSAHDTPTASSWVTEHDDFPTSVTSPDVVTPDHQWVCTGFEIDGGSLTAGTSHTFINVEEPHTIEFEWQEQWLQTFASSGLGSAIPGQQLVEVTVTGGEPSAVQHITVPSGTLWVDAGATVAYVFSNPVLSTLPNTQYWLHDVTGPLSGYTVAGANTITGNYIPLPLSQISTRDGVHFRLIFTNDPLDLSKYKLTASNPGQFHYTIFCTGAPGTTTTISITIPYPFVTQGAVPFHLYSYVDIVDGHFVLSSELSGFTISPLAFPSLGGLTGTLVTITGTVPLSGLVVVTIHLDYGLKKESGYSQGLNGKAVHYLDHAKDIADDTAYVFSFHDGVSGSLTIRNVNVFKHDPGFAGIVTDAEGTPLARVQVEIRGPTGALLATIFTDEDGFYFFYYKYTGKAATFTVRLPSYGKSQSVTLKPNTVVQVNFTLP
jgi:hypothetical protein